MMGNENSQISGLEIEEKPIELSDFWCQYQAKINDSCRYFSLKSDGSVSVFKGEAAVGPLWAVSSPLEKFSNNLLKYRHPCIVRYISAWQQRSYLHLVTEYVQPLSHLLQSVTPLQICIGLNNILRALVFLHDQAGMSHNNISVAAIYVTGDGQWKLGGMQYLCAFQELTPSYLKHSRIHRYDKAIDPNEDTYNVTTKVDHYSFAVLVEDVFRRRNDEDVPHLKEFKKYCRDFLQNHDPTKRPSLSDVLKHSFFNHEFITIYKFLNFLPLKAENEKCQFFSNILENLKCFDEETVAKQLSGLLLSRLTMLDQTAQKDVIPYILKPKNGRLQNGENFGFFSLSVFKEHVKPRLMQLFGVRDSQIRMLLLSHFSMFVHVFSHDELSQQILPELLLGIKDTDDTLVASTLICLSELVPILGADTVIGGNRLKYFTDGRPNSKSNILPMKTSVIMPSERKVFLADKSIHELPCSEEMYTHGINELDTFEHSINLHERPSPVGGESIAEEYNAIDLNKIATNFDSEDDWSDWDNTNRQLTFEPSPTEDEVRVKPLVDKDLLSADTAITETIQDIKEMPQNVTRTMLLQKAAIQAKKNIVDISELDIKNQKAEATKREPDEFDFFADMTPVIEKPSIAEVTSEKDNQGISNKLNFIPDVGIDESEGWEENWNE